MQGTFDIETRAGISNEIARMMGLDGQDAHRSERDKVVGIDLRYVDDGGDRETQINEFTGDELNGPNAGLDSIVRMIESATMRDASTRYGNVLYAIYFHLAGNQKNRGRHPFYVAGGAHMMRGGGGGMPGNALAMRGGGSYGGFGLPDSPQAADALKVAIEFLKWSTEERREIREQSQLVFKTQQEVIKAQAMMLNDGMSREMRVRELENDMLDHKYELDKKRKADEERERWVGKAIEAAETYGPMLLPPVVEAIRKFNGGPNYVPQEMNLDAIQEQIRKAKEAAAEQHEGNGHAPQTQSGHNGNGNGNGHPPTATAAAPDEPSPLEILQYRIAFDLTRLISLVKSSGHLQDMRAALEDSAPAQQLLDQIVAAAIKPEVGSTPESTAELCQLALMFGSALMQAPMVGLKLGESLKGFERAALLELSDLLKRYVEFAEQVAADQAQQSGAQHAAQPGAQR